MRITGATYDPEEDRVDPKQTWRTYFQGRKTPDAVRGVQTSAAAAVSSRLYLQRRGIAADRDDSTLRWSEEAEVLTIEIDAWSPEYPASQLYRPINQPKSKWMHLSDPNASRYGYGLRHHVGVSVMLVEGVFDVLTPNLLGFAVATLGTPLRQDALAWMLSRQIIRAVLWLDPDLAGYSAMKKNSEKLQAWGIDVIAVIPSSEKFKELGLDEDPRSTITASEFLESDFEPGDLAPDHPHIVAALKYRL